MYGWPCRPCRPGLSSSWKSPTARKKLADTITKAVRRDTADWQRRLQAASVASQLNRLTAAEREVMDMVLAEQAQSGWMAEINLSVRAIEDRRAQIMRKLGVNSRTELIEWHARQSMKDGG